MKILLFSNSGKPLYGWCKQLLANYFNGKKVTFISASTVYDPNEYFHLVKNILKPLGLHVDHLRLADFSNSDLSVIESFLVGGGNTYHLLLQLKKYKLLKKIRNRVLNGALYAGLSAGANVVGPNILTTNDWNVIGLRVFGGLNLVPFNINPHYNAQQDKILSSAESRDERIYEYFEFHHNPVVALDEETYLEINDDNVKVGGRGKAKLFLKGHRPKIYKSGDFIKFESGF